MPTLRADFSVCETYRYLAEPPLQSDITAFGGAGDPEFSVKDLVAWREETNGRFALHVLRGDHFFMHESQSRLLDLISQRLAFFMNSARPAIAVDAL